MLEKIYKLIYRYKTNEQTPTYMLSADVHQGDIVRHNEFFVVAVCFVLFSIKAVLDLLTVIRQCVKISAKLQH